MLGTLLVTSLALWFGPLALVGNGGRKVYEPATLFNLAVFYYAIKGLPLAWGERPPFLYGVSYYDIATIYPQVAVYVASGLLAWNWGYALVMHRTPHGGSLGESLTMTETPEGRLTLRRCSIGVLTLTLVGVGSLFMLFRSIGQSITAFLTNPWSRAYLADPTYGIGASLAFFWLYGVYMLPVASVLWLASSGAQGHRPRLVWWAYTTVVAVILFLISPRAILVSFVISLLLVYHLLIRRVPLSALGVSALLAFLYSYLTNLWRGIMGGMRTASILAGIEELATRASLDGFVSFFGGQDLSDIRLFVLIAQVYGHTLPLKYGETLLRILTQFIPRALWPAKPYDLGLEIMRLYNSNSLSGIPPGFFPEMYMNFQVLGVLAGGLLLGVGMAWLYRAWIIFPDMGAVGVVLYAVVAPKIILVTFGTFANVGSSTLITVAGAIVALFVSGSLSVLQKPKKSNLAKLLTK